MDPFYFYIAYIMYALIMIVVGFWIFKKEKNSQQDIHQQNVHYWCANRNIPGWHAGISLAAGWMMLGWVGLGIQQIYMQGAAGLWVLPIPWFILIFLILFIVPYIRRLRSFSLPRAILHRFGKPTSVIVGICSLFIFISWMGAELFMAGNLMSPFINLPPSLCMMIFLIPVFIYMVLGGFRAIVLTDVIQFGFMSIFMISLTIVAIKLASAVAPNGIIETLSQTPTASYGQDSMFSLFACGRILPVILLIAYLPGWLFEQDLTLRIFSCKSLKETYLGITFGGFIHILFTLVMPVIIAFCAILIFPPGEASEAQIGTDALGIIPALIQKGIPPLFQIFMFIGILAIQMSTVDSFANISAMAITHDVAEPLFMKNTTNRKHLLILRILAILTLFLGLLYAFFAETLYAVYTLSSGVLTACVAIPVILLFIPKSKPLAALLAAIFGFIGNIVFFIFEYYVVKNDYSPKWLAETYVGYIVVGILAALIGVLIGQIFGKKPTEEQLLSVAPQPHSGTENLLP